MFSFFSLIHLDFLNATFLGALWNKPHAAALKRGSGPGNRIDRSEIYLEVLMASRTHYRT
jgi:hypothetical protein